MSHGRSAHPVLVKRRRMAESALHDHAVAITGKSVTRRAEYVVALAAAFHDFLRHGIWERIRRLAIHFSGIQQLLRAKRQFAARDRPRNGHARGLAVSKKVGGIVWVVARLHVHIEAASSAHK